MAGSGTVYGKGGCGHAGAAIGDVDGRSFGASDSVAVLGDAGARVYRAHGNVKLQLNEAGGVFPDEDRGRRQGVLTSVLRAFRDREGIVNIRDFHADGCISLPHPSTPLLATGGAPRGAFVIRFAHAC